MEEFVNIIIGDSVTLDVYVIVRLCVVAMALEFSAVVFGLLARLRGR